jgi:hypothetical protein
MQMATDETIKLAKPGGVPEGLLRLMEDHGIDPRARFVEAADGWRYGDPHVDVSAPGTEMETIALTLAAIEWINEQIGAPEDQLDPAATVLELSRPDWLD